MLSIQKRTRKVRDAINRKWHERYWKFIIDNPDKPWSWYNISKNPILTMKFIQIHHTRLAISLSINSISILCWNTKDYAGTQRLN